MLRHLLVSAQLSIGVFKRMVKAEQEITQISGSLQTTHRRVFRKSIDTVWARKALA
jgi:hypothetical protein